MVKQFTLPNAGEKDSLQWFGNGRGFGVVEFFVECAEHVIRCDFVIFVGGVVECCVLVHGKEFRSRFHESFGEFEEFIVRIARYEVVGGG